VRDKLYPFRPRRAERQPHKDRVWFRWRGASSADDITLTLGKRGNATAVKCRPWIGKAARFDTKLEPLRETQPLAQRIQTHTLIRFYVGR